MSKRLAALNASDHPCEFFRNENPKCPHCGADYDIDDNEAWNLYTDEHDHEVKCPSCDLNFTVITHCAWSFSTEDQDEDNTP